MLPQLIIMIISSLLPFCLAVATCPSPLPFQDQFLPRPTSMVPLYNRATTTPPASSTHDTSSTSQRPSTSNATTSSVKTTSSTTHTQTVTMTVTAKPTSSSGTAVLEPYTQSFPPKKLKPPKGQQNVTIGARDPRVLYGSGNWVAATDQDCGETSAMTSSPGAQMQFQFTGRRVALCPTSADSFSRFFGLVDHWRFFSRRLDRGVSRLENARPHRQREALQLSNQLVFVEYDNGTTHCANNLSRSLSLITSRRGSV